MTHPKKCHLCPSVTKPTVDAAFVRPIDDARAAGGVVAICVGCLARLTASMLEQHGSPELSTQQQLDEWMRAN